jgi:hypothetical protein
LCQPLALPQVSQQIAKRRERLKRECLRLHR